MSRTLTVDALAKRGFKLTHFEDHLFVLQHSCGREFAFGDHADPAIIDEQTEGHALECPYTEVVR